MSALATWRSKRSERRLRSLRRALEDAVYRLDKWSFADSPSAYEDRQERIFRLIRRYEQAGGDALALIGIRFDHLVAEAMPGVFERRHEFGENRWRTYRRPAAPGEGDGEP